MTNRRVVDYAILVHVDDDGLEETVKLMLSGGWEPLGPPFFRRSEREMVQAMVKYE